MAVFFNFALLSSFYTGLFFSGLPIQALSWARVRALIFYTVG